MIEKKFTLKIVSNTLVLLPVKRNLQFITVSNIKIETVQSYINRNGAIIQLATKVRKYKLS